MYLLTSNTAGFRRLLLAVVLGVLASLSFFPREPGPLAHNLTPATYAAGLLARYREHSLGIGEDNGMRYH
jgi:hypothetical protein